MYSKKINFLFFILAPFFLNAQVDWSQPAPVDPAIRIGKLDNGMTYYIRHNEEPKERASFYIIQNAGALLEEDNQNGLAHFLEHMAFNGTEHFPGKGIINTLEKHGVAFGRNINAYTAYNETIYNLSDVPVIDSGLVDTCLLVLNDWSNYLLLTPEEIDAERGVITEEWRTRRDAGFRMRSKYFPVLLKGSKFAVRDIIGDINVIKNFQYETLRQFYHDWYRTDLQAIVIVGDIDVDKIEARVKELFSKIPPVENEQERPFFEIPEHIETRYVLATDEEASQYSIAIYIKHKAEANENKNLNYIREMYIQNLYNAMMSQRITELLQKGDPPFVVGSIGFGDLLRGYDMAYINATAKPNEEDKALKAIYSEAIRLKRFGFTQSELDRAKLNLLTSLESFYKQRDKISNDQYIAGIQDHFLTNEPLTSAEFDWELGQQALQSIILDEVSEKAKEWITDKNRVIIITGPEGDNVKHLTEKEAFNILNEVENSEIEPYKDMEQVSSLIDETLSRAEIIATRKLEKLDAVEWTLANKARVIFRHADFEKDNILLVAYSPGGSSVYENDKVASVALFSPFINSFGVGNFDAISLNKILTGKKVSLNVGLSGLNESVSGSSTPNDFETLMQLLYLQFEHPRFDKEAYDALAARYKAYLTNMENNPDKIMSDSISLILTNYSPRTIIINQEIIDKMSFSQIEEMYNDRFIDAGDFTFFIVGNIDVDTARQMAQKYIGSIKDNPREEDWIDRKVRGPEGKTEKQIAIPLQTEKATIFIHFNKNMAYSPVSNLELTVVQEILKLRYTEEIREKEGGAYGIGVSGSSDHFPVEEKSLQISFDTDPEKAVKLKSIVFSEIDKIKNNGSTQEDLDKVVTNLKKDREQSRQHNNYWMGVIQRYYLHGYNS
ncbi:MAG: insulinase family protein, partial [Prolixibacteraceae bacterium]|nr:insulinase family protein [Prolixibacteraceae bacterium]